MRLILEVAVVIALIAFAWDKSYRDRVSKLPLVGEHLAAASPAPRAMRVTARSQAPSAQPAATSLNGAWMWDPNHKTALDRPAYNQNHSFTGHAYYVDNNGARYWVDASGQRHYEGAVSP